MTFGSLFAGIGGFDLGLERAGMTCKWQVEINPYARRVLEKHWPHVRRHDDVRTFPPGENECATHGRTCSTTTRDTRRSDYGEDLYADFTATRWHGSTGGATLVRDAGFQWTVDLICGGFPCQDISGAGLRSGLDGERSGLWREFHRIIGILRPRYVVVENVGALLVRGLERVLGDLSRIGYDAEWSTVSACAVGTPHLRRRLFVVAYPNSIDGKARMGNWTERQGEILKNYHRQSTWANPHSRPMEIEAGSNSVVNGFSGRMVGLGGNAVVPQCAEFIGRMIMESERPSPERQTRA